MQSSERNAILKTQTIVCATCHYCFMSNGTSISITLSPAQVDQVVRAAAQGSTPSFSALVSSMNTERLRGEAPAEVEGANGEHGPAAEEAPLAPNGKGYLPVYDDARLSRSLLRGLSILTCFGPGHEERGILELAGQLGMSPSTTHRYVVTLVELGLLERSTRSRKYRLPATPASAPTPAVEGEVAQPATGEGAAALGG
jgi:hypothetical protein